MRGHALTRAASGLVALALLGGCVLKHSQPARLYVLAATAATDSAAVAPGGPPASVVGVLKVTVPDWTDRAEITERGAGGEITSDPFARWGEPIARGIQRVVLENLATLLPDRHLAAAPFAARQVVDQRVEITITEAARQTDGSVLVEARYRILGPDGASLRQGRSSQRARPAAGAAGTVTGLNEALLQVSREIAEAVKGIPPVAPKETAPGAGSGGGA